jgi:hypothetical protein
MSTQIQTGYPTLRKVYRSSYPKTIKINGTMPFRVKFLPGIMQESSSINPAPIGVAVIGVNNYIL